MGAQRRYPRGVRYAAMLVTPLLLLLATAGFALLAAASLGSRLLWREPPVAWPDAVGLVVVGVVATQLVAGHSRGSAANRIGRLLCGVAIFHGARYQGVWTRGVRKVCRDLQFRRVFPSSKLPLGG